MNNKFKNFKFINLKIGDVVKVRDTKRIGIITKDFKSHYEVVICGKENGSYILLAHDLDKFPEKEDE